MRFEEGSASRHWQSSHVAYGALKKVLKRASQASGRPVGRSNYGPPGRGLLDLEEVRRPSDTFLERGLDDEDRRTLEILRARLLKQNKEDDLSEDDEEAKEYDEEVASLTPTSLNKKLWIRALDRDKSRAFFLHGFDCALAAEVATAERRYAREAASLERRWTAIAPSCQTEEDPLEASKAAPEPLKLQLAALDSEARALVDFVVWNLCAVEDCVEINQRVRISSWTSTPSSRRSHRNDVASMAWGRLKFDVHTGRKNIEETGQVVSGAISAF